MGYYTEIHGLSVHVNTGSDWYPPEKELTMLARIVRDKKESLGKHDLCSAIAEKTGLSYKVVSTVWDAYHESIMAAVSDNHKVIIRGFASFSSRYSPERTARNPQTEEEMIVPEKVLPAIRFGEPFRRRIANKFAKKNKDAL